MSYFEERGIELTHDHNYWRKILLDNGFKGTDKVFVKPLSGGEKVVLVRKYDNFYTGYHCYSKRGEQGFITSAHSVITEGNILGIAVADVCKWIERYEHDQLRKAWERKGKSIARHSETRQDPSKGGEA